MKGSEYQKRTSYVRGKLGGGWWERGDPPSLFKSYRGISSVSLPRDISFPPATLRDIFCHRPTHVSQQKPFSLTSLSVFLFLNYGITAVLRDERFSFRTVPSAGALYPAELYIAVAGVKDLRSGIYHYNPASHNLTEIAKLEETDNDEPFLQAFVTGIFYRSSSKYRERAFRYVLLDGGHLIEQVFLAGQAVGFPVVIPAELTLPDGISSWEDLLGVDPQHESVLGTVTFGTVPYYKDWVYEAEWDHLAAFSQVARKCPVPPIIRDVSTQTAGEIMIAGEAVAPKSGSSFEISEFLDVPFAKITLSRRSRRNFLVRTVNHEAVLGFALALQPLVMEDMRIFFVVERCAERFSNGIYELSATDKPVPLHPVKQGSFLFRLARACLDQTWLGDAVLHVVIAASLADAEERSGPSAYRKILLQAGRLGQRVYLVSEAIGLGCCGIGAFYDNELRDVLELDPRWQVLYLLGVGVVS